MEMVHQDPMHHLESEMDEVPRALPYLTSRAHPL